jgi:O-antigen ligase
MSGVAKPLTVRLPVQFEGSLAILLPVGGAFALSAVAAILIPQWFWLPLAPIAMAALGVFALRHTVALCVVWLIIAGSTLEMTLGDLISPDAYQATIAAVKFSELLLVLLCMARYGASLDLFNPALAFLAMFLVGLAHGLHADLTTAASLRSLLGSIAPFAFAFSRLSPGWGRAIVRATTLIPLLSVLAGTVLDAVGLRPLFQDSGGQRLAALGHPAFLAGVCLAAIYACLIELYRDGKGRWMLLLAANFLILILTGARAPLAYAIVVTVLTLGFVRSSVFAIPYRLLPIMLVACLVPLALVLAQDLPTLRLFNLLSSEPGHMSGRDLLWPAFQEAAEQSRWFGWGVGAGNAILDPDSRLAVLIGTGAAHNEYLRVSVEGGQIGCALLIALFILWVARHTRALRRTDKAIVRLAFLAFAAHAYTDNVLIATTACVFFTFAIGVFASAPRLMDTGEVA